MHSEREMTEAQVQEVVADPHQIWMACKSATKPGFAGDIDSVEV